MYMYNVYVYTCDCSEGSRLSSYGKEYHSAAIYSCYACHTCANMYMYNVYVYTCDCSEGSRLSSYGKEYHSAAIYSCYATHVLTYTCRGFESHPFFLGEVTALGVLCCFALFVCLTLLASFFLPSHISFKNMYIHVTAVKGISSASTGRSIIHSYSIKSTNSIKCS